MRIIISMKNTDKTFWVMNVSKRDVSLSDLNISIKAMTSVNLLSKHYHFTEEMLEKSITCGSMFAKKDKIWKRTYPPGQQVQQSPILSKNILIPSRERSIVQIKIENHEELNLNDVKDTDLEFDAVADTADHC